MLPPSVPISRPDASLDPGLAHPAPDPYAYRSPLKQRLATALDALGGALMPATAAPIAWEGVGRVAVLRLDHLGDLLLSFPALAALRRALPQAQLDLYTGVWGAELGAWSPSVDRVVTVDAPWFQRGAAGGPTLAAILGLGRRLRAGRYDLVIDLRGEGRHLAALRLSGARYRLGHAQSAGRFLLTHFVAWDPTLHECEQSLELLRQAGLPGVPAVGKSRPALKLPARAKTAARSLLAKWKMKPGFIAVHASAGSPSRLWPREHWVALLRGLPPGAPVLLLGSAPEREGLLELGRMSGRSKLHCAAGETGLAALAGLLAEAGRLICLNSGPGHLAAALGTPVLALYSAANDPARWGPLGPQVTVLSQRVPCGPCELALCPYDNECLRRLAPQDALAALRGKRPGVRA